MRVIGHFGGQYRFLANPYPAPTMIFDVIYPTSEHAFHAGKCTTVEDRVQFQTPGLHWSVAKRLGRAVRLRSDWEDVKSQIMRACVYDKFTRNPELGRALLATGDAYLIEGNAHGDTIWGQVAGAGENRLGLILMEVRATLRVHQ